MLCYFVLFVCYVERSNAGIFVPWNIRSHDGTFVLIRSLERSFPRRINTADISLLGPFVPWTVHSLKLSFQVPGPLLPRTIRSFVRTTQKAIGKLNRATDKLSAALAPVYVTTNSNGNNSTPRMAYPAVRTTKEDDNVVFSFQALSDE